MKIINSKENATIKHLCKLKEKKYRNEYCQYLIEGVKLIKEAIKENANLKNIIISKEAKDTGLIERDLNDELQGVEYIEVPDKIFKLITDVEKPQGILAVIEKKSKHTQINFTQEIILALDDVQDPGNLGTIIRTADSAGLTQILVSKGTVDPYNSKVIRSTMGAIFRVNIIECDDLKETLKQVKQQGYEVMVTSLEANNSIYDLNLKKKLIVMGNESKGVSKEIINFADEKVIIPMLGKTESLNVSVATGVVLYEYVRQKILSKKE